MSYCSFVQCTHATTVLVQYKLDTYDGSSGAPLLYFGDSEVGIVIMGVHLCARGSRKKGHMCNEGSVLTTAVLQKMMNAFRE